MIQRTLRRWLFVLPTTWAVLLAASASEQTAPALTSRAWADDQTVALKAQARSLFEDAMKLAAKGRHTEACPMFQESQRLDPGMGTKFYLADCLEHIGRYASAWVLYMEVTDEAGAAKATEREEYAKKRADAIQPKLTRMMIVLPDDVKAIPGIEVRRDGVVVPPGQWGLALPVDAGKHTVAVGAPSRRSWETTVDASGEGAVITVAIPTLPAPPPSLPASQPPPPPPPAETSGPATWPVQRTIALGVGGVGLVGLGLGIGMGLDAAGKVSSAKSECNDAPQAVCTQKGSDLLDSAKTPGTVSTVGFIAGGALLVGGVVLFLTAPSAPKTAEGAGGAAGGEAGGSGGGGGGGAGEGAKPKAKESRRSTWIAPVIGNTTGVTLGGTW